MGSSRKAVGVVTTATPGAEMPVAPTREWLDTERGPTCACGMPTYVSLVFDVGARKLPRLICFAHNGVGASYCLPSVRPEAWPFLSMEELVAVVDAGIAEHAAVAEASASASASGSVSESKE